MPNVHKNAFTTNKAAFFLVGRAAMYEQMYKCPNPSPLPPITTSAIDMRIYAETNEWGRWRLMGNANHPAESSPRPPPFPSSPSPTPPPQQPDDPERNRL